MAGSARRREIFRAANLRVLVSLVCLAALAGLVDLAGLVACHAGPGDEPAVGGGSGPGDLAAGAAAGAVAPLIDRVSLVPEVPLPGRVVRAAVQTRSSGPEALALAYVWRLDGQRIGDNGPAIRLPSDARGSLVEVMVIARDGRRESRAARVSVRVGNQVPKLQRVVLEPSRPVTVEDALTVSAEGLDPDGDAVGYRYRWIINGSASGREGPVLPTGWTRRGDRVSVSAIASDGVEQSTALRSKTVVVQNAPPRIDSEPGAIAADGVFRYTPRVFDADGDRLFRYALLESPRGMRIDLVDGRIEWRPSEAQAGSHRVVVRVDVRNGDAVTQSFRIEVSFREFPVGRRSGGAKFGHGASLHGAPRG